MMADNNLKKKINGKKIITPVCCFVIGSKNIGLYGGYETFIMNLLQQHKDNESVHYYVTCKANGQGHMDVDKIPGTKRVSNVEFTYCNARCFLLKVPEKIGAAQAVFYDISSLKWVCNYIEENHILNPIVYILASRIGLFEKKYVKRIHKVGGLVYQNPDGHENWRKKWSPLIRKYWKVSERYAVKNADLVVCDSKNIESYIKKEYSSYKPNTTFIAYGAHITPSILSDDAPKYQNWLAQNNITTSFYICISRFVEENNYKTMIQEFMASSTKKDFVIITTDNPKYAEQLQKELNYKSDKRIKFVGTVYDAELLKKIREKAYGYLHGHEVGGTNPSLLESLGSTNLNLLLDVGFNKEVAKDAALYWTKNKGELAALIDKADQMTSDQIAEMGAKAKKRISDEYSWKYICDKYLKIFSREN
jgi:rhamnosyltransferase